MTITLNWVKLSLEGFYIFIYQFYNFKIHSLNNRSNAQQEDAISLLEHLKGVYTTAQEAVALGDGTLKEANNTYHTLAGDIKIIHNTQHFHKILLDPAGFQSQVQQSSESANLALKTVPGIEKQIQEAQNTVHAAEDVIFFVTLEKLIASKPNYSYVSI